MLKTTVHWLQGEDAVVRSLLAEAERMPRALHTLEYVKEVLLLVERAAFGWSVLAVYLVRKPC